MSEKSIQNNHVFTLIFFKGNEEKMKKFIEELKILIEKYEIQISFPRNKKEEENGS